MRIGRFEEADGGNHFSDEISEMSPGLQAQAAARDAGWKISNASGSNREIRTNGAHPRREQPRPRSRGEGRRVSARIYFYRLNVVELNLPPLRERRETFMPLANCSTAEFCPATAPRLAEATVNCLQNYPWPGNVRELRNAIERAVLLSQSELILPRTSAGQVARGPRSLPRRSPRWTRRTMDEIEAPPRFFAALKQHQHNRTETAKALGISRRALLYKLQRLRQQGF